MRVLIVGCGYVGLPLGGTLVGLGHKVHGLRRSVKTHAAMEEAGIVPHAIDITRREQLDNLLGPFDWIINTVSSGRGGAGAYHGIYVLGTQNLIDWFAGSPPQKYLFASSTGVYGQTDGSWVDEDSPTEPSGETGQTLLEAESLALSIDGIVLRLSGIYGPDRGHLYRQFLKGEAVLTGNPNRWMNMIHRDDVIGCILAAMETAEPGTVSNATDNEPVTQQGYFQWLAGQLDRPLPPQEPEVTPHKRAQTNKRVANSRARKMLSWTPKYPTWREGYAKLMESEGVL
jgi:nucleoside-diphosphate-sugar epimerase